MASVKIIMQKPNFLKMANFARKVDKDCEKSYFGEMAKKSVKNHTFFYIILARKFA